MTEGQKITYPYERGVDIPKGASGETWEFVVNRGKELLADTAFVTGASFTQKDIDSLKQYYQEVFDYQDKKFGADGAVFNRSLREHLLLAERIAQEAAPILGIDTYLLQGVALTHDFGRIFSHRRGRNNAIERVLSQKIGFNRAFTKLLPPDTLWTDVQEAPLKDRLQKITTEDGGIVGAVKLIDVLAKWENKPEGRLRKWESVISSSRAGQHSPEKKKMWPSELKRQRKIASNEGNEAIATKYEYLKNWFEGKTGLKVNNFVRQVEKSLADRPLKESWT